MGIKEEEAARKDDPAPITTKYSAISLCVMASAEKECTFTHMRHTKRPPLQRDTEGCSNQEERIFNEESRASPTFDRDFTYDLVNDND